MLLAQENKILSAVLPVKAPGDAGRVDELRWYRAHPGKAAEWLSHFKAIMPVREKYSKNVGLWQTEAGQLNEVVHLWAYRDLNHRAEVRGGALKDPEWQKFPAASPPLLAQRRPVIPNPPPPPPTPSTPPPS